MVFVVPFNLRFGLVKVNDVASLTRVFAAPVPICTVPAAVPDSDRINVGATTSNTFEAELLIYVAASLN